MYYFSKHAFACAVQGHVVILDVKLDAYCVIPPRAAHWLQRMVSGWPATANDASRTYWPPDTSALSHLLRRGILTMDSEQARRSPCPRLPEPVMTLASYEDPLLDTTAPLPSPASMLRLLWSCLRTGFDTRFRSLDSIVSSVERHAPDSPLEEPELVRTQQLVTTYRQLRPVFFGSAERCLFSSLSLLHFLRANGVHASWMFGVQLSPFAAHCWLQRGPAIINDRLERVRRFTPIMVV